MKESDKPKVLLITLSKNSYGGVVSYNEGVLKNKFCDILEFRNTSGMYQNSILKAFSLLFDIIRLSIYFLKFKIDIVHINPSLTFNSIIRDSLFINLSKLFGKKVLIQWHGWNPKNEILLKGPFFTWFKFSFFKADMTKFLYRELIYKYLSFGYSKKINLGKTFVEDYRDLNFNKQNHTSKKTQILFLATLSKNKGVYEVIEIFKTLSNENKDLELKIAGKGTEMEKLIEITDGFGNIELLGFVSGDEKEKLFLESDIYIFPSDHEGMPISVLEAMYFGLPVVCTRVGALNDFFEDDKMGFSFDKSDYDIKMIEKVQLLINNIDLRKEIGDYNKSFIKKNFLLENVLKDLARDYKKILNGK